MIERKKCEECNGVGAVFKGREIYKCQKCEGSGIVEELEERTNNNFELVVK
jgi:DnaJ-class molecular chaperone